MKISRIFGLPDPDYTPDYTPIKRGGEYICRICEWRGGGDPCDACLRLEEMFMPQDEQPHQDPPKRQHEPMDLDVADEVLLGRGSWESDKPQGGFGFDYDKPEPKLPEGW